MTIPHELYIRFLVTLGYDSKDAINRNLRELNLPDISSDVYVRQAVFVQENLPKGVIAQIASKKFGPDFMKAMKAIDVDDFWYGEGNWAKDFPQRRTDLKLTIDIHKDPLLRLTISALMMKGMNIGDIIPLIAGKFAAVLKENHLNLFKKLFFRHDTMTRGDWRKYLAALPAEEQNVFFLALTEDIDVVKTELGIAARISSSDSLQFLLQKSMQKAKNYLSLNTPTADKEARAWISQIVNLTEKYEKYKSSDTSDFSKALQLEFDYIDVQYPTPDNETLADLNASAKRREMQMKEEADEEEESTQ